MDGQPTDFVDRPMEMSHHSMGNHRDRFLIPFHTSVQFIYERVRKPVTLVLGIQVHVYSLCMIKNECI